MPDLTATPFKSVHTTGAAVQVLASKGMVNSITCYNGSGAAIYIMLFDRTTALSGGETPTFAPVPIEDGGYYESTAQRGFVNGCYAAVSDDAGVYSDPATTDIFLDVGGMH